MAGALATSYYTNLLIHKYCNNIHGSSEMTQTVCPSVNDYIITFIIYT